MVGVVANPEMIEYLSGDKKTSAVSVEGFIYHGNFTQFWHQGEAAAVIIVWNAVMTFLVLKLVSLVFPLRASDVEVEGGDLEIHGMDPMPPYNLPKARDSNRSRRQARPEAKLGPSESTRDGSRSRREARPVRVVRHRRARTKADSPVRRPERRRRQALRLQRRFSSRLHCAGCGPYPRPCGRARSQRRDRADRLLALAP